MKLKALLLTMLAAGVAASLAVASPPADKGREGQTGATPTTKTEREPKRDREGKRDRVVTLMLKGAFVSASDDSFAMLVKHSNKHARSLRGKQITVLVDDKTKFRRQGPAELADLVAGDRLLVLVRARKAAGASSFELLARFVNAKPARPEREDKRDGATTDRTKTGTTASDD